MGWKGTVRSIRATARKIEREAKRREKELARQRKEYEKMQALEQAAYEVEVFENYIDRIQSMHKESSETLNWESILKQAPPIKPTQSSENEAKAKLELNQFKPNFFQNLFKKTEKITSDLENAIEAAKQTDKDDYEMALKEYEVEKSEWEATRILAQKVIDLDSEALIEIIKEYGSFNEIDDLGTHLNFSIEGKVVAVEINVHGEDIIPSESKSLLKSGKLSVKKMAKGVYYELYQDYVCSCILRIAREVFALLPIKMVTITAIDEILNSSTGHLEKQPILSVLIPRKTLDKLNMDMIDPSDSMTNFVHNMSFKKTKGFKTVEKVQA